MCAINVAQFQICGSLVAFFFPLVIMIVTYSLTIKNLQKQVKFIKNIIGSSVSIRKHPSSQYMASSPRPQWVACCKFQFKSILHLISLRKNIQRKSLRSIGRSFEDDLTEDSVFTNGSNPHFKAEEDRESTRSKTTSCWKFCSKNLMITKHETDWASNDSEDMDYTMYRSRVSENDQNGKRLLDKSVSLNSRTSECTR